MDAATMTGLVSDVILLATMMVFIAQTRETTKQSAASALATRSGVYQSITDTMIDIDRLFVERPELRGHFYDEELLPDVPLERARVLAAAELLLDFMDNVITQAPHMPEYLNGPWRTYMTSLMESSSVLRDFWEENRPWYSTDMQSILDPLCPVRDVPIAVIPQREPDSGFSVVG